MAKALVRIEQCIQNTQSMSPDANKSVMVSHICFQMRVGDKVHENLVAEISQPYGSDYASDPIEVGPPHGYDGPFNHHEFSEGVEEYYRSLIGPGGSAISFGGGGNVPVSYTHLTLPTIRLV